MAHFARIRLRPFPWDVCDASLVHVVKNKTEAAYFRTDLLEKRRALVNDWEQFATRGTPALLAMRA